MAGLSVIFKAVDEISDRFESMATAGDSVLRLFEQIEHTANNAFSNLTRGTESASSSMDHAADSLEEYRRRMDAAARNMDRISPPIRDATEEMEEFGDETEEAGDQSEEFGERASEAISSLNSLLVSVGIAVALKAITDAFKACSDAAAEFERNVAMVTTVADTAILSAGQLAQQITDLSGVTAQSVNELADSTYNAISAGIDTADAVETVGVATKLSEAGFTSVTSSLSVLTTALNAYQLEASELTKVSDSLVMAQNLGVLTIDQLSSSIGKAISTASAYSIDLYNLESGYVSLTKAGISVEEATTYISSMFNELGAAGTEVANILQEETGRSFGQLMNDGYTLAGVLEILYNSVDQNSEALMNLWGSAEAGKASNAIINQGLDTFNQNLEKLSNSAGTTERAYQTMTSTTEFSTRRMENSFKNLSIAIGDDLNPAIRGVQNGISGLVDGFVVMIQKYPAITAVFTGLAVGIGVVTVGVTAYVAVTKLAAIATAAFGTTVQAALGPVALIVTAISAVAAGVIYYAKEMEEAADIESHLTVSSQKMSDELDELKGQYEEIVQQHGRTDSSAIALQTRIEELSASFEANKTTIGDLIAETESLSESVGRARKSYEDTVIANGQLEYGSRGLISQLMMLSSKSTITSTDLEVMQGIVDKLNGSYEDLGLTLDVTNGKLNLSSGDLYEAVAQAANEANRKAAVEGLMGVMQQFDSAHNKYQELQAAADEAGKAYEKLENEWKSKMEGTSVARVGMKPSLELITAQKDYAALAEEAEQARLVYEGLISNAEEYNTVLGYSADETAAFIEQMKEAGSTATELGEGIVNGAGVFNGENWLGAAQEVVDSVKPRLEALTTAYDEAYTAARNSIEGQIGLFEVMKTECSQSTEEMLAAFESQIEYLNNYAENIQKAQEYGLDADLIAKLSDGSAESAGQLDAIISKVEELGTTTEEAQTFISDFNTKFEGVSTAKDTFSRAVADMQTSFSAGVKEIADDLAGLIKDMDMSKEATAAAHATINAYISVIKNRTGEVNTVLSKLAFPSPGGGGGGAGIPGKATGTADARPGLTLVGETGPELIMLNGGETVYTATETDNILSRGRMRDDLFIPPPVSEPVVTGNKEERIVVVKLEGAGELRVDHSANKQEVVDWMTGNMRDVLLDIVQQEILEEGDMAYEF